MPKKKHTNKVLARFNALVRSGKGNYMDVMVNALNVIYTENATLFKNDGHNRMTAEDRRTMSDIVSLLCVLAGDYAVKLLDEYYRLPKPFVNVLMAKAKSLNENALALERNVLHDWEKENIRILKEEILSHDAEISLVLPLGAGGTLLISRERKSNEIKQLIDMRVTNHIILTMVYETMLLCRYEKDNEITYAIYSSSSFGNGNLIQSVEIPVGGDTTISSYTTGEKEVVSHSNTEFKPLPFRMDGILAIKDDVRGDVRVSIAPRELTTSEQFMFYHKAFKEKDFSDDDATLAAIATMDEYAFAYTTQYFSGRDKERVEFLRMLNTSYLTEEVSRRMDEMWADTEFEAPMVIVAAKSESVHDIENIVSETEDTLSPTARMNMEHLLQHICGIKADKELYLFTQEHIYRLTAAKEFQSAEDERKTNSAVAKMLMVAFAQDTIIVVRMTADDGNIYHTNGFITRDGELYIMNNQTLAKFCQSEQGAILYEAKPNEYFESPLIDFAQS